MKQRTIMTATIGALLCIAPVAMAFPPEPPEITPPPEGFGINEVPDWCPFGYNAEAYLNLCLASGGDVPGNIYTERVYVIGNASVEIYQLDPNSGFTVPIGIYGNALCNQGVDCGCIQVGRQLGEDYDPVLLFCAPIFA